MYFEIIGDITEIETIATGSRIRDLARPASAVWEGALEKVEGACHSASQEW